MAGIYATPRVPTSMVSRPRLSALLSTDAPLVVVRAPAGSGKTVAVADWANQLPADVHGAWFTVDAASSSRVTFWHGLLQVMHDTALLPDRSLLHASFADLDMSPDLRRLLLRGFAQLRRDLVLVIDDLHLIRDPEVAHDLVALVGATPGLRIVAITRVRGELELDSVAIALGTVLIEAAPLMFTAEETARLVESVGMADAGGRLATSLRTAVGGLPLTTRGVLLLIAREGFDLDSESAQARLEAAGADVLRDVWAMQVGDDRDVDFVIRCSVPEVLTTGLAVSLTGRADAEAVLRLAESIGVGLWTEGADGVVFAFSPAIRDELRLELDRRFPGEVRRLTQLTARWCLEHEQYFAALKYAIEIGDIDIAEDAITQGYRGFLRPHSHDVLELLGHLPLRTLRKSPLLTMLLALALNASGMHRVRAMEMFALAVVSVRMHGDKVDPVRRAVLLTIESAALRVTGQMGLALAAAERTAAHYEGLTLEQKDQLRGIAPTLLTQTGLSFFYSGRTQKALNYFKAAYALPPGRQSAAQVHSLSLTAGLHAVNGDMPEAEALVEIARGQAWPDGQRAGYLGALYQVAEGFLALEAGDFETALGHVTIMEPHLETIEHWPLFMHLQSMAMLGTGRALEASTTLGAALQRGARPSVTSYARARLDATRALLLISAGQLRSAENILQRHGRNSPAIALEWARLYLTLGKPDAARLVLQPLADESLTPRLRTELLLLRSASALRLGETEFALDNMDRAVALLEDRRLRMPLLLVPGADREALASAAAASGRHYGLLDEVDDSVLLVPALNPVVLTEREHVVLHALATTASTAEMAATLFVSVNTVKSQLRSLYRKLGANSREDALRRAGEQGLLQG